MNTTGYWIMLAAGCALAGVLFVFRLRAGGEDGKKAAVFALSGMLAGALAGYLLSKTIFIVLNGTYLLEEYGIGAFFRLRAHEFSFAGAAIGFCLGLWAAAKLARGKLLKGSTAQVMDAFAVPGCLLVACLRMAELFLEQMGLGEMATLGLPEIQEGTLLAFVPVSVPDGWGGRLPAVCTFEALTALLVGLACLLPKKKSWPSGLCFRNAAYWICSVQILLELLRIVSAVFFFVHVDQALCAIVLLVLMFSACRGLRKAGKKIPAAAPVLLVVCLVVNGLTQYFMDKPWKLEGILPGESFYWVNDRLAPLGFGLMALTVIGMIAAWILVRKRLERLPEAWPEKPQGRTEKTSGPIR